MNPRDGCIALFAVTAIFVWVLWIVLTTPVVEWSWTTGECVRIIPPEAGHCGALPDRYERVWVR